MNIARHLIESALCDSDKIAIVHDDVSWTYREFLRRTRSLASGLRAHGLRTGDAVAVQSANSIHTLQILYACFHTGLMAVPVHFKLQPEEVEHILSNCGAKLFFHDSAEALAKSAGTAISIGSNAFYALERDKGNKGEDDDPIDVDGNHPAWLFYTSGTTGRAKGATLTHSNLQALVVGLLANIDPASRTDVFLHAGPMSHASGLCALAHVARGTTQILLPAGHFSPERVLETISRKQITTTFMVPTVINRLTDHARRHPELIRSLKTIIYGGAPMPEAVIGEALDVFGPVLVQLYGQGEAPHVLSVLTKEEHLPDGSRSWPSRLRSAGRPCLGSEIRIADDRDFQLPCGQVGEIQARGDVVMRGYWKDDAATKETLRGGWLHTGDLGYLDEHGYLFITDRKKELIISGGMNVYSREVEDVLHRHPAVKEAAVVGEPHPDWGEAVKAVVVFRHGREASEEELIDFCRLHLAPYKRPKRVVFVAELPRGATGKIQKRSLQTAGERNSA
jgi:acyl-CoA synthetase (AMP-forming)/AMP-acid ligase II